jgi:hypothetical protein
MYNIQVQWYILRPTKMISLRTYVLKLAFIL